MIADLIQLAAISGHSMELYASYQQRLGQQRSPISEAQQQHQHQHNHHHQHQHQQQQHRHQHHHHQHLQQQRLKTLSRDRAHLTQAAQQDPQHHRQLQPQRQQQHHAPASQLNLRSIELLATYQQQQQQQPATNPQCKPLDLSLRSAGAQRPSDNLRAAQAAQHNHLNELPPLELIAGAEARIRLMDFDALVARHQIGAGHKLISSSTSPSSCSRSAASSVSSVELISSTNLSRSRRAPTQDATLVSSSASSTQGSVGAISSSHLQLEAQGQPPQLEHPARTAKPSGRARPKQKPKGAKSHLCNQCGRCFSRSDMLTRHSRLHSGLKPYQCAKCKQVFSRSDHLSTHERTHTGEKPYQCQFCAYSACRRDMITRHMRTHTGGQRLRSSKELKVRTDSFAQDAPSPPSNGNSSTMHEDEHHDIRFSASSSSSLSDDVEFE